MSISKWKWIFQNHDFISQNELVPQNDKKLSQNHDFIFHNKKLKLLFLSQNNDLLYFEILNDYFEKIEILSHYLRNLSLFLRNVRSQK